MNSTMEQNTPFPLGFWNFSYFSHHCVSVYSCCFVTSMSNTFITLILWLKHLLIPYKAKYFDYIILRFFGNLLKQTSAYAEDACRMWQCLIILKTPYNRVVWKNRTPLLSKMLCSTESAPKIFHPKPVSLHNRLFLSNYLVGWETSICYDTCEVTCRSNDCGNGDCCSLLGEKSVKRQIREKWSSATSVSCFSAAQIYKHRRILQSILLIFK